VGVALRSTSIVEGSPRVGETGWAAVGELSAGAQAVHTIARRAIIGISRAKNCLNIVIILIIPCRFKENRCLQIYVNLTL